MKLRHFIRLVFLGFFGLLANVGQSQDIWLQNYFSPLSGCNLTNAQVVNVLVNNNSTVPIPPNFITVRYTVNGGTPVSQLMGVTLGPGASWNFNFNIPADLSACGTYQMKSWVELSGDPNPANDTVRWTVQNDCSIVPGAVESSDTVCISGNSGNLNLVGWNNGTIVDWEFSTDGGIYWTGMGFTGTTHTFSNISTETYFRVIFNGGLCGADTSGIAIISVQPEPIPGVTSGANSVCATNSFGTLALSGASGPVLFWEYSTDNGSTWINIPNTTNTEDYLNLTQTRWYRAFTDGGVCPGVYSDTAFIYVESQTIAGTLFQDNEICEGDSSVMNLTGRLGNIVKWEFSTLTSGNVWSPVLWTQNSYTATNMQVTTRYRVIVQNGICPEDTSNVVTITVHPLPVVDAGQDVTITQGDTTTLTGTGGFLGIWTPGSSLSDSTITSPLAFPQTTTTYTYYVITAQGCVGFDDVTVTVVPPVVPPPVLPPIDVKNAITANNDGINDNWIVEGVEAYPLTRVLFTTFTVRRFIQITTTRTTGKEPIKGRNSPTELIFM